MRIAVEQKDTTLKHKLMAEAPGILAWIVSGAMTYLEHGLQDPPVILEAVSEYQTESDPIGDFIARYLQVEPGDDSYYVSSADLRKAWIAYCEEEDVMGIEAKQIGIRLKGLHGKTLIGSKSIRLEKHQPTARAWVGFMLNTDGDELKDRGEELDSLRMVI